VWAQSPLSRPIAYCHCEERPYDPDRLRFVRTFLRYLLKRGLD